MPNTTCPQCGATKDRRAKLCMACSRKINNPALHRRIKTADERFWSKVVKSADPDGCWLWVAGKNGDGYGTFFADGKVIPAHHYPWVQINGPLPVGKELCHICDTPACVRPDHLWAGSHRQNMEDAKDKGRTASGDRSGKRTHPESIVSLRGEDGSRARLTWEQVGEIRRLFADGVRLKDLYPRFGVSKGAIESILKGRTWQDGSPAFTPRDTPLRGEECGAAKLDWDKVHEIRRATGASCRELASRYEVAPNTISLILNNRTWKE